MRQNTKVNDIVFSEGKYYGAKNTNSYAQNSTDKTTISPNFYIRDMYNVNVVISKKDRSIVITTGSGSFSRTPSTGTILKIRNTTYNNGDYFRLI